MRTPSSHHRSALTLLELVVVLVILAALGGMLLPLINNYRDQTTEASAIDSITEISKLVEISHADPINPSYPNNLDSLVVGNELFAKLASTVDLVPYELDANQVTVLANNGITHVYDMNETVTDSATFLATTPNPRTTLNGRLLVATGSVARVTDAAVLRELETFPGTTGAATNVFIAFGFGDRNSLVGSAMQEAPYNMPSFGNPNSIYSRYLLIFEIPGTGATGGDVQFRGTVLLDRGGIAGQQSLAEAFYNVQ